MGNASWAPDGAHISWTERKPEYFSGKLEVIKFDPRTGQADDPAPLYTSPTDRGGWSIGTRTAARLRWSCRTAAGTMCTSFRFQAARLGKLTRGEYDDLDPVFAPDGKPLAVVSNRETREEVGIWIVSVDGAAARELTHCSTPGVESSPEWSPDGKRIFFCRTSPLESTDLLVADSNGTSAPKYLTHMLPKNFESALQAPERIRYPSKDGKEISAILYKPENLKAGIRAPAVLWIHRAPEGQDVFRFDPWAQYLTQQR